MGEPKLENLDVKDINTVTDIGWKGKTKIKVIKHKFIFFLSRWNPHTATSRAKLSQCFYIEKDNFISMTFLFSQVRDRLFGGSVGPFLWAWISFVLQAFPDTLRVMWKSVGGTVMEPVRKQWEGGEEAGGEGELAAL